MVKLRHRKKLYKKLLLHIPKLQEMLTSPEVMSLSSDEHGLKAMETLNKLEKYLSDRVNEANSCRS